MITDRRLSSPRYGSAIGAACSLVIIRAHQSIGGIGRRSAMRSGASISNSRRNSNSSRDDHSTASEGMAESGFATPLVRQDACQRLTKEHEMNKRRERLSPVIDAERRKSGVLERRASGLEVECAQLGRDLVVARASIAKSLATIRGLQDKNHSLQAWCSQRDDELAKWKETAERAWAYNREFRDTPVWRIAIKRIAARFGRPA